MVSVVVSNECEEGGSCCSGMLDGFSVSWVRQGDWLGIGVFVESLVSISKRNF